MSKRFLVTGGAGFIGSNYVSRLLRRGEQVHIYDNLSRHGAAKNLAWLEEQFGKDAFQLTTADIRDASAIAAAAHNVDVIVHLAAQVAVTTSVTDPRPDFEINAQGTFNVLEAARAAGTQPIVVYASTNKVYGGMEDVRVVEEAERYRYADYPDGISEAMPLDFHSPYGCSKGSGDQYVRDYHRIYDLPTVVMRQSCIYGPRQFGVEDQGWVAWFMIAAITGKPITIYGDGKQVRDVLFVEDLLDAYDHAIEHIGQAAGSVFNLGGGPANTISIWTEFGPIIEHLAHKAIPVGRGDWRPGDQKIYVSDIGKAARILEWKPRYSVQEGMQCLFDWVKSNRQLF
ncbi:MAG: GDP-mannose 4,6-dehydratase [Anaerolineaceae bacterium]|nr:GDP-mannose 4,6-dehydratase [Anaerolineaceae bacterium]